MTLQQQLVVDNLAYCYYSARPFAKGPIADSIEFSDACFHMVRASHKYTLSSGCVFLTLAGKYIKNGLMREAQTRNNAYSKGSNSKGSRFPARRIFLTCNFANVNSRTSDPLELEEKVDFLEKILDEGNWPPEQRENLRMLKMRFVENLTLPEISKKTQMAIWQVQYRLKNAKSYLWENFGREWQLISEGEIYEDGNDDTTK